MSLCLFTFAQGDPQKFYYFASYLYAHQEAFYNAQYSNRTHLDLQRAIAAAANELLDEDESTFIEQMNTNETYIDARTPIRYGATKSVWATPTLFVNNANNVPVNHTSSLADWCAMLDPLLKS